MTLVSYPQHSAHARRRLRTLLTALLVGGLLTVSTSAFAQDDPAQQDPAAQQSAASDQTLELAEGDRSAIETKMDSFWSVEKDLPAIKERRFTRDGKFSAGLFAGVLSSEAFYWYIPVGLRATYFLSDNFGVGVEGSFTGATNFNTELSDYLEGVRPTEFTEAMKKDRFLWRAHAVATWHPLYGKLAFLQRKLVHFDVNLVAGLGAVGVDRPNVVRTETSSEVAPDLLLGGGVEFFFTENVALRVDGRFYVYPSAEDDQNNGDFFKSLEVPAEFLLGASFLF